MGRGLRRAAFESRLGTGRSCATLTRRRGCSAQEERILRSEVDRVGKVLPSSRWSCFRYVPRAESAVPARAGASSENEAGNVPRASSLDFCERWRVPAAGSGSGAGTGRGRGGVDGGVDCKGSAASAADSNCAGVGCTSPLGWGSRSSSGISCTSGCAWKRYMASSGQGERRAEKLSGGGAPFPPPSALARTASAAQQASDHFGKHSASQVSDPGVLAEAPTGCVWCICIARWRCSRTRATGGRRREKGRERGW